VVTGPGQLPTDQLGVESDPTGHDGTSPNAARSNR
jgi:hypothetical protein